MRSFDSLAATEQQALEEAAGWLLRLEQEPACELSSEYRDWIAVPVNRRAFLAVDQGRSALARHSAVPEILGLRARAIRQMQKPARAPALSRKVLFRAAAAMILASVLGGSALYVYVVSPVTYETGVGTRRIVALSDGSRISLDSDSEVRVRYTDAVRKIILDHGRARFDVAHDTTRPFTVTAGSQTVVAIGTSFNVEKIGSKVLVTLIQGRVVIKNSTGSNVEPVRKKPVALKAGEEFVIARDNNPVVKPADIKTAMAWEAGQLIFKNVSLEEAAARENRYTKKAIAVDPSVASLRISGVFNAGDVSAFVNAVTNYFPVQATTTANDQILLQSKP